MMAVVTLDDVKRKQRARALGLPLSSSWAEIHALEPEPAGAPQPEDERALEKTTQSDVVKVFRALGCFVNVLSQPRATKQTPGLPDLYVQCERLDRAWWWETKRPAGGKLSTVQEEFRDRCLATSAHWATGSRIDAENYAIALGLAYRMPDGTLEPTLNRCTR